MTFRPAAARILLTGLALAQSACFATRNDMRILQGDILTMRQEAARADSARARQISVLATSLQVVGDSLRQTGTRLTLFQGENRGEFRSIGEQLLQLQSLVGQSQAVVERLRAENEQRLQLQMQQAAQPTTVPTTPDSTQPPVATPTLNPGPNQLYQDGLAQARRGSFTAAQAAFQELLRLYPTSDLAPDAQYYLAEAYEYDNKQVESDSAYAIVVSKYPKANRARTALYKMALSLARRGRRAEARTTMERVTRDYPGTDEADLAAEWLRTNR